jgi:hypothetical protein
MRKIIVNANLTGTMLMVEKAHENVLAELIAQVKAERQIHLVQDVTPEIKYLMARLLIDRYITFVMVE